MKEQGMVLGSYHKSNDSSCKASVSDFVLYSFSHRFLAGDGGDAAGCYNSNTKGSYYSSKARAVLFNICTQLQDLFRLVVEAKEKINFEKP